MIDPETARQAVLAWDDALDEWVGGDTSTDYVVQKAGDALAVLVPQLLDKVRWFEAQNEHLADRVRALESEKAQLVDQLAEARQETERMREHTKALADDVVTAIQDGNDARIARDALGERCQKLRGVLARIEFEPTLASAQQRARAALGDTPPPEFYEDDEDPAKVRAAFNVGEKGYTTGTRNVTHDLRGDTPPRPSIHDKQADEGGPAAGYAEALSVEPPQPETPEET